MDRHDEPVAGSGVDPLRPAAGLRIPPDPGSTSCVPNSFRKIRHADGDPHPGTLSYFRSTHEDPAFMRRPGLFQKTVNVRSRHPQSRASTRDPFCKLAPRNGSECLSEGPGCVNFSLTISRCEFSGPIHTGFCRGSVRCFPQIRGALEKWGDVAGREAISYSSGEPRLKASGRKVFNTFYRARTRYKTA